MRIRFAIKMKDWKNFTIEEKLATMEKLNQIYKKHGYPKWLKTPQQYEQIVCIMNQRTN